MVRERTHHDTDHTVQDDWPLALKMNDRRQAVHCCADCGYEIPDGTCVERREGVVVAWLPDGTDSPQLLHVCEQA